MTEQEQRAVVLPETIAAEQAAWMMNRAWRDNDDSLPPNTHSMEEMCGMWLRVVDMWGPKDLGNGPCYALELLDNLGVDYIVYCGSRQIVGKLRNLPIKEYVADDERRMCILFTNHERGDKPYYTANVWFGTSQSASPMDVPVE